MREMALRVAVGPAADRVDRALRWRNSPRRPSRASSRRRGAGVACQSAGQNGWFSSRSSHMSRQRSPTSAGSGGVALMREHGRAPGEVVVEQAAAHVVDVVGIAVVGRAERDDRLQRRRPPRRDLQRVEAAPGHAHHADRAAAPGLRREPGDHLERVVLLLLQIFVEHQAVGIARAAHVDADRRRSRGRRNRHASARRARGAVALAVGQVFEDRRHRVRAPHPPAARSSPIASLRPAA